MSEDVHLTYGMLDQRANQLAHALLEKSVGPEICVGIYQERSCDMVVSMYAVLKAGGAYVPLDPSYPLERLTFMLDGAQIHALITTHNLKPELMRAGMHHLYLEDEPLNDELPVIDCPYTAHPEMLAYVIYTSGSTGKPKGAQITQRGLHNLVCWHQQAFELTPQERASQVASLSFDAAGWEIWPYLASGATIYIVPEEIRTQPLQLLDWLAVEQITVSFLPTPLAEELLAAPWTSSSALRLLLTGGDRLHRRPGHILPCPLINNYGPTEYSVVATSGSVAPLDETVPMPSIGRPIARTRVYILDQQLCPVPVGMEGELYLSGEGLARGYLYQPALTAERFIPDPFVGTRLTASVGDLSPSPTSCQPGGRLYRTGDLVRADAEGNLHFLGRADGQVKIRGFRLELGEIEAALHQLPMVREAVVLLRENTAAEKRLVAYLVPQPTVVPTVNQVRQQLQTQLPGYMLPSAIVLLERLPLTPNGKIDRTALPDPEDSRTGLEEPYIAPRNAIEEQLAAIWANLLGMTRLSIQDNFFALGGHSLLATRAVARIRERLQVELSLRTLFDFPTIDQLATHIAQ